jgi:hypothetical protein
MPVPDYYIVDGVVGLPVGVGLASYNSSPSPVRAVYQEQKGRKNVAVTSGTFIGTTTGDNFLWPYPETPEMTVAVLGSAAIGTVYPSPAIYSVTSTQYRLSLRAMGSIAFGASGNADVSWSAGINR